MKNKRARSRGSDSTDESLRGKNRELQKEIKQLNQKIRQLEKQLLLKPNRTEEKKEKIKPAADLCPACGKGNLNVVAFPKLDGSKIVSYSCDTCDYKEKKKI